MTKAKERIQKAKTIVVKVGTSTITHKNGNLNLKVIEKLVRVLSDLKNEGRDIVLVTSGAIGVGRAKMGMEQRPATMPEKQALAAIGQVHLMYIYAKLFGEYGHTASQVLLTKDVLDEENRKANALNTFKMLLQYKSVPIVNENDTVSTEEIESVVNFGDNDTLSAIVSVLIGADLLILLSDIDGLYDKNPKVSRDACLIPVVTGIDEEILRLGGETNGSLGTGGMRTKLNAARVCGACGIPMVIANGDNPENLYGILTGQEIGTLFVPKDNGSIPEEE